MSENELGFTRQHYKRTVKDGNRCEVPHNKFYRFENR